MASSIDGLISGLSTSDLISQLMQIESAGQDSAAEQGHSPAEGQHGLPVDQHQGRRSQDRGDGHHGRHELVVG